MNPLAAANAKKLIEKYRMTRPLEYSLVEIINAEGLYYVEENLEGCAGSLFFDVNRGFVVVNKSIKEATQKRFVAAHELGHYCNEKANANLIGGEKKFISCRYEDVMGINRNKISETNANDFACEFLMHDKWFLQFVNRRRISLELIKEIANHFDVSLTAAALRYSELGGTPVAVILSKEGAVKWSSINKYFPFTHIPTGYKVNKNSYAHDFFVKGEKVNGENEVLADAWFWNDKGYKKNYFLVEANFYMDSYNSVMTFLWERE